MAGQTRRGGWRAVGVTAVGFAVGAGALGVLRTAVAEPIRAPLLPAPVSAPQDDQPTWTKKADAKDAKLVPARGPVPAVPTAVPAPGAPPAVPPLPSAAKPDAPTLPAFTPLPPAAGAIAPPVAKPETKPTPAPESKGPVDVRLLRFPTEAKDTKADAPAPKPAVDAIPELPPPTGLTEKPKAPPVSPPTQPEKSAPPVVTSRPAPADSNLRPKDPEITLQPNGREPAAPAAKPAALPVSRTGPAPTTVLPLPKAEPSSAPLSGDLGFPQLSGAGSTPVVVPRGFAGSDVSTALPTTPTGDAPMKPRPTPQLMMSAVLGAALATTPVRADDPKPMPPMSPAKADATPVTLESLKKEIDTLRDDIRELKTFRSTLTDIVQGKKDGTGADAGLIARLSGLEATLNTVNDRLKAMDAKLGDGGRSTTALRADTGSASGNSGTIVNAAHVRIVNDYPVEMSMIVNRKSYRVGAGETRVVDVPPGSYTYELLHAGAQPVTSTIKDNETVTLRIR